MCFKPNTILLLCKAHTLLIQSKWGFTLLLPRRTQFKSQCIMSLIYHCNWFLLKDRGNCIFCNVCLTIKWLLNSLQKLNATFDCHKSTHWNLQVKWIISSNLWLSILLLFPFHNKKILHVVEVDYKSSGFQSWCETFWNTQNEHVPFNPVCIGHKKCVSGATEGGGGDIVITSGTFCSRIWPDLDCVGLWTLIWYSLLHHSCLSLCLFSCVRGSAIAIFHATM